MSAASLAVLSLLMVEVASRVGPEGGTKEPRDLAFSVSLIRVLVKSSWTKQIVISAKAEVTHSPTQKQNVTLESPHDSVSCPLGVR